MWRAGSISFGIAATLLGAAAAAGGGAPTHFVDVSAARGLGEYRMAPGMGGGAAAADFDDDGFVDLFVPNTEGVADQLYRNLGDGSFVEEATARGLASTERGRAALWLDTDGDRRLDLVVASDCNGIECVPGVSLLRLLRQQADGTFTDVTAAAGLFDDAGRYDVFQHRSGLAAGDLDGDGFLDLYVGRWQRPSSASTDSARVFRNLGDGSFADVSRESGIATVVKSTWQSLMHDFDGDGATDVFVAVDFTENLLWHNRGDMTFLDIAPAAGVDGAFNEMGATLGDYDGDGDLDLYVTNIFENGKHNRLYRNLSELGQLVFEDVAIAAGVADTGWGWGATFFDADNDGHLDLAVTNGFRDRVDTSKLFLSRGDGTFADVSAAAGFDDDFWGNGLVAADLDRDGDLDLLQACNPAPDGQVAPLRLLDNQPAAARHYLVVRPRSAGRNPRAIGATVHLTAAGTTQMRLITAGTSFLSQEPAEAFFGLGDATAAERVRVRWPNGTTSILDGVAVDRVLTVGDALVYGNGFESGDLAGWSVGE